LTPNIRLISSYTGYYRKIAIQMKKSPTPKHISLALRLDMFNSCPPFLLNSRFVKPIRIKHEPKTTTSRRSHEGIVYGGADRDRTGGLLVANQALSQLSYSPLTTVASFQLSVTSRTYWKLAAGNWLLILVGLGRVELPTSPLSGVRSSHLSYRPGWLIINQKYPGA
jgi:hypothetical protein